MGMFYALCQNDLRFCTKFYESFSLCVQKSELEALKKKSKEDLWMDDLEEFMQNLEVCLFLFLVLRNDFPCN